jgi:hypothetical protein
MKKSKFAEQQIEFALKQVLPMPDDIAEGRNVFSAEWSEAGAIRHQRH